MQFQVGQLLKEPVGSRITEEIDLGPYQLTDDLFVDGIRGKLQLVHVHNHILVHGKILVDVTLECIRCLAPVKHTLEVELQERFRPPPIHDSSSEQIFPIGNEGYIDLGPVLRELIIVGIPMHVLCRPDCKGLCSECGQNLNTAPCECQPDTIDSRLAVLQTLMGRDEDE